MHMRGWVVFCLALVIALGSAVTGLAQTETATLTGRVSDPQGAVVPGAQVEITNIETGIKTTTTTNNDGLYVVPSLHPGRYRVIVRKDGFKEIVKTDIVLHVQDNVAVNFSMEIGSVAESVTVTGGTPLINTESAAVSTVVDRQFAENLPLNGRSFQSLIALTPGVVFSNVGSTPLTGGQFSVNGQRTNANYFTVDGVSANYGVPASTGGFTGESGSGSLPALTALGGTTSLISVDALQEFRIQTSSFAPEFGRTPGGQISLVSRSGTNNFHGTLFDYLRNDVLDASDWFANRSRQPKAKERQNDFGGTLGGPIVKNRTFFFFSYEGLRLRQPVTSITRVPSVEARQLVADVVKPFFNAYAIPNLPVVANGLAQFATSYSNPAKLDAYNIRIDQSLTHRTTLFGTYKRSPSQTQQRGSGSFGVVNNIVSSDFENDTVTAGFLWFASNSVNNDLRFNWARARTFQSRTLDSLGGATVPNDSSLFPSPFTRQFNVQWSATNGQDFAGFAYIGRGSDYVQRQLNIVEVLSWVRGAHQFKVGADYRRTSPILNKPGANFLFRGFRISPQPMLSLLQVNIVTPGENVVVFNSVSAYTQDTWSVRPRLRLTYGLRWDLNVSPYSASGRHPSVLLNLGGTGPATFAPPGTRLYETRYANFAPRLGISYQLLRKPGRETVLRGGAGVFYDIGTGVLASEFEQIYPYLATRVYNNIPYPIDPITALLPVLGMDPPQQFYVADPKLKLPYTVQWNAAVEQPLGRSQTITLSYVGSAGRRLLRLAASRTTVAGFGSTLIPYNLTTNDSWSDYRALQIQFQRRLSRGIQGLLSYTWGRSYDASSSDNGSAGTASLFLSSRGNYAPSDFDVRHTLSGALTVDIPAIRGSRTVTAITEGWGLDTLLRFRTALPTTLTASNTVNGIPVGNRPNVVTGVPQILSGPQFPGGEAVNPAAFTFPANETVGNFPRNSLRFFNASQFDVALRRQFALTEKVRLQARFEFFNIFNHPNFADPIGFSAGSNVSTRMLSQSLGGLNPLYQIGGPRSGQVSLKFIF